jgi:ABC-type uncharacterized transport system permease subunit
MTWRPAPTILLNWLLLLCGAIGRIVAALIISAGVSILFIHAIGGNVRLAMWSLWDGAFGDPYNLGNTLVSAIPLILSGLGVAVAFRCRMWNIGGEGQFLVGCLAASALALNAPFTKELSPWIVILLMLAGSFVAGAVWAGIAAVLKTWRNVPEVISTIMLNFVAIYLVSYLVSGPMERPDHSQPATAMLSSVDRLPLLNVLLPRVFAPSPLHIGCLLAIVSAVAVFLCMNYTRLGFSMKLVGANVDAARLAGVSVSSTLIIAMVFSGALCGLAGGVELCGRIGFIPENYSPGYGFEAIAVALLGRLSPIGVILSAVFIGALSVGCQNMERNAGIAHEMGFIIQAVALLTLLATQWPGWSTLLLKFARLSHRSTSSVTAN